MLFIFLKYADLIHVFLKDTINILSKLKNHKLHLETTGTLFGPFYNLLQNKLKVVQVYMIDNQAKKFILHLLELFSFL